MQKQKPRRRKTCSLRQNIPRAFGFGSLELQDAMASKPRENLHQIKWFKPLAALNTSLIRGYGYICDSLSIAKKRGKSVSNVPLLGQRLVRGETMAVDINKARVRLGAIWAELGYDQGVIRSPDGFQTVRLGLLCWTDTTQKKREHQKVVTKTLPSGM